LFYKNLADNKTQNNNGLPNINEIKEFWSNIWSNEVQFNNQAEWIPNLENEIPDSNNPHHIQISLEILGFFFFFFFNCHSRFLPYGFYGTFRSAVFPIHFSLFLCLSVMRRGSGALSPATHAHSTSHSQTYTTTFIHPWAPFPTGLEPVLTSRWWPKEC
jgi:hypothetical protein